MKLIEKTISFAGETLTLTNQRAVYWAKHDTVILSDLHLGKGAHFRKHGIAIPVDVATDDLLHLQLLLHHYRPSSLVIVGDFVHAGQNSEVNLFKQWRRSHPETKIILVKGNHDRLSLQAIEALGVDAVYEELNIDALLLRHEFDTEKDFCQITGHLHPGVVLKLPTKRSLRFPCYVKTEKQLILPAFSRFTGLDTKSIPSDAVRYAFYEEEIFEM